MAETAPPSSKRPSVATFALVAAGLIALGAVGVQAFRSADSGETAAEPANAAAPQGGTLEEAAARLEARLREDPDDAAAWRDLGQTYFALAREAQAEEAFESAMTRAAAAYRRAAELEPRNAENWFGFGLAARELRNIQGAEQAFRRAMDADPRNPDYPAYVAEMLLLRGGRNPPPEAETLLRQAAGLDPQHAQARYYLATLKDRRGDHQGAIDDLVALLRDAPAGAPWEAQVRGALTAIAREHDIDLAGRLPAPSQGGAATAAIPGPTREQMDAARSIPPGQQDEMVRGMVDRLAARLRQNPRDADGWVRLMRSRMVLREPEAASEALRSALAAFQGDAATQARLRSEARTLAVPGA